MKRMIVILLLLMPSIAIADTLYFECRMTLKDTGKPFIMNLEVALNRGEVTVFERTNDIAFQDESVIAWLDPQGGEDFWFYVLNRNTGHLKNYIIWSETMQTEGSGEVGVNQLQCFTRF